MNIKGIENLKLSAFAKTRLIIKIDCPSGNFLLAGDNYKNTIEDEAVFSAVELLKIVNADNPSSLLKDLITVKKQLPAKLMEVR